MKKLFYAICLSLLLCMLNSCENVYLTPQARQSHHSLIERRSWVCGFTSFDRSVFGISVDPPSDDNLRVIAGFATSFEGGKGLFACNKLNLAVVSGRFSFDLSTINPERFNKAFIVVDNFTPIGKNIIQEALPWGLRFGQGWIGELGSIQNSCQFKVKFVTDIPATSTGFLSPPPPTRELRIGEQIFSIANGGSGDRTINVTAEIRNQLASGINRPFFLVEPTGYALDYQASNRFLGSFTFRLNVELALE